MLPPLEPSQVPDIWFCSVCVARNWHVPPIMTQSPPAKAAGMSRLPTSPQSGNIGDTEQQSNTSATDVISLPKPNPGSSAERSGIPENPTHSWKDTQGWKEARRWKENSSHAPRGYLLDPSPTDRFIPLYGVGPSIPLSTIKKVSPRVFGRRLPHRRTRSTDSEPSGHILHYSKYVAGQVTPYRKVACNKSPPRKRYKYSDVPVDVENALDLIRSHLYNVSQSRKSQDDVEDRVAGFGTENEDTRRRNAYMSSKTAGCEAKALS